MTLYRYVQLIVNLIMYQKICGCYLEEISILMGINKYYSVLILIFQRHRRRL
jgi:hypothetical protein